MHELVEVKLVSQATPANFVAVQRLVGDEEIGKPFLFDVVLITAAGESIEQAALLEHPVSLEFVRRGVVERTVHGVVWSVRSSLNDEAGHLVYRLEIGPRFRGLALSAGSEVFLDKSVVEIIALKLERAGLFPGADFQLRLRGAYPQRDLTMQYGESDLAFVTRLCEHWGISISFEHPDGRDVVVFSDDNSGFTPIHNLDGTEALLTHRRRGDTRGLYDLDAVTRTLPAAYIVDDYNYRTPAVALRSAGPIAAGSAGVMSEFGPHAKTPGEAQLFATVRSQEIAATRHVLEGKCDETRLRAGCRVTIDGHPTEDGEIVVTAVHHEIEQSVFGRDAGARKPYRAEFHAIPGATPFRPARVTPKPRVAGVIPAIIESAGGDQYADPDGDGRYHVRFKLDAGPAPLGQASKLVRMTQPHLGAGYGFHMPLRSGVEVMVACLDGDPDRPVISGAVPNPTTPSVVNASNAKRNVMRFGGGSEINVDDQEGSTRIKMTVPYGNSIFQIGAPNAPVKGFYFYTENDEVAEIGGLVRFQVGEVDDKSEQPPGSFTVVAETKVSMTAEKKDMSLTARDSSFHARAGSDVTVDAGSNVTTTAGSSISSTAQDDSISEKAGTSISNTAGTSVSVTAGTSVDITAQSSTMTLDAATSITAHSKAITLNGDDTINENSKLVTVEASTKLVQHSPEVSISGDRLITIAGDIATTVTGRAHLGLGSETTINADAKKIVINGSDNVIILADGTEIKMGDSEITIAASTKVFVKAPTVEVEAATEVKVNGAVVNVTAKGLVNVNGSMVKLNC